MRPYRYCRKKIFLGQLYRSHRYGMTGVVANGSYGYFIIRNGYTRREEKIRRTEISPVNAWSMARAALTLQSLSR